MKKKILLMLMMIIVVVACSNSEETFAPTQTVEPSATPKLIATETRNPTPIVTLVPTATMPLPTPTPAINVLPWSAYWTLLAVGEDFNSVKFYLAEREVYTVMLENDLDDSQRAEVLTKRGIVYDSVGDLDAAIQDYGAAAELDATNSAIQYSLCWDYALTNQPETGLPHCEEAVKINPKPYFIDGRAITYAMLGRFDDALQDYEIVIADLEENNPGSSALQLREGWVSILEGGENPFTPEMLTRLKNEFTMMVDEAPVYVPPDVDYSREAFQRKLEAYDFTFGEVETEDSEEVLIGRQQDGTCQQGVKLIGPQTEISMVKLSVFGCTDANTQGNIANFMGIFFFNFGQDDFVDSPWLGKLFAWIFTDVNFVIEGVQLDPVSIEIENILFNVVAKNKLYILEITVEILPKGSTPG